jgi:alpha-L-fucosidase
MRKNKYQILLFLIMTTANAFAQYQPNWASLDKRETPEWWKEAKFGIFIHWGLYSVPAYAPVKEVEGVYEKYAEHYENRLLTGNKLFTEHHNKYYGAGFKYKDFAPMFRAEYFDPDDWADLFQQAGARYVVLTSKHHDGFCLWPSKESPGWNSVETGPHRDLIQDLTASVRKKGLHMGLYYSLLEWNNPLYKKETMNKWVDTHMIPQMKDLVVRYQPEVIFADGEWDYSSAELKSEQFLSWLYNESAVKQTVVVNDRWGKETRSKHGGYYTTEYDLIGTDKGIGKNASHPWEESRGIGTSYGYNRFETSSDYFSSQQLIELLLDKVSNGGNLLLDIGPDANGLIPVVMQERLLDIGGWLKVNGEGIYGTTAWDKRPEGMKSTGVFYTRKNNALYVICSKWPDEPIVIDHVSSAGKVEMIGLPGSVKQKLKKNKLTISPNTVNPSRLPSNYAWVFKIPDFKDAD